MTRDDLPVGKVWDMEKEDNHEVEAEEAHSHKDSLQDSHQEDRNQSRCRVKGENLSSCSCHNEVGEGPRIVAWRACAYGSEAIMIWIECECRRGKSDI